MKKNTAFIVFIILAGLSSRIAAQNLFIAPMVESTIVGIQYGGSAGYLTKKSFSFAAFYLRSKAQSEIWPSQQVVFYGIQSSIPLVRSSKLLFGGNVRAGLANNQFVVVVPGVETRIKITSRFYSVIGASWRYGHAAINTSLVIKL